MFLFIPFSSLFFRFIPVRGSPPLLPSRAERSGDPGSRRPWGRGKNKQPGPRLAPPVAARPGRQEGERRRLGGTFPFVPFHSLSFPFLPFQGLPPLLPSRAERSGDPGSKPAVGAQEETNNLDPGSRRLRRRVRGGKKGSGGGWGNLPFCSFSFPFLPIPSLSWGCMGVSRSSRMSNSAPPRGGLHR